MQTFTEEFTKQMRPMSSGFTGRKLQNNQMVMFQKKKDSLPQSQIPPSSSPFQYLKKSLNGKLQRPQTNQTATRAQIDINNYIFEFDPQDNLLIHNFHEYQKQRIHKSHTSATNLLNPQKKANVLDIHLPNNGTQTDDDQFLSRNIHILSPTNKQFKTVERCKSSAVWKIMKQMEKKQVKSVKKTFNPILKQLSRKIDLSANPNESQYMSRFFVNNSPKTQVVDYTQTQDPLTTKEIPIQKVWVPSLPNSSARKAFSVRNLLRSESRQ